MINNVDRNRQTCYWRQFADGTPSSLPLFSMKEQEKQNNKNKTQLVMNELNNKPKVCYYCVPFFHHET